MHAEEGVNLARVARERDGHARLAQAFGVGLALVAQGVVFGGDHVRGGQARVAHGAQGRGVGMRTVAVGAEVVVPEPPHALAREQVAVGVVAVGGGVEVVVGDGVDEQLEADGGAAFVAGAQGDDGGEVAARGVAAHGQPARVRAQFGGAGGGPDGGGVAVLVGGGEAVFGREAVVHGDEDAARAGGQLAAGHVRRVEVADDPAAAVEPDEQGQALGLDGAVDAHGDVARGAGDGAVLDARHLRAGDGGGQAVGLAHGPGILRVDGRGAERGELVKHHLRLGMERHAGASLRERER